MVYAGLAGSDVPTANFAPTSIYVIFWVGLAVLSVLFGDVFRAFNPWRSLAVAVAFLSRGRGRSGACASTRSGSAAGPPRSASSAFAWLELAYPPSTDRPVARSP